MRNSLALLATKLAALCALFALAAPTPAAAQVTNSGFDSGGSGWAAISPPGWTADFPTSGGNPGVYGRILSPSVASGGKAWFRQAFSCGIGHFCNIRFDYRLEPIAASPGSARVEVWTNGVLRSTLASPTGASWRTASLSVSCGPNVALDLCLEVDAGDNAWRTSFDNVRADCSDALPGTTSQRFDAPGTGTPYALTNHSGDAARVIEESVVSPLGEEFQQSFLRLAHETPSNLNARIQIRWGSFARFRGPPTAAACT
jgi:hypothetical protein